MVLEEAQDLLDSERFILGHCQVLDGITFEELLCTANQIFEETEERSG